MSRLPGIGTVAVVAGVLMISPINGQPSLRRCDSDPALHDRWAAAWNSLGIAPARGPERLGDLAAERWFGARNWFPIDGRRQIMCGKLAEWTLYNGAPFTKHELDIHPTIIPGEGYRHFVDDLPSSSRVNRCDGSKCVYGEVTASTPILKWLLGPDPSTKIEARFPKNLAGCVYGPWVMERVHHWLPEIHPVEQFWGQTSTHSTERVGLLLVQDSSNRYTDPDRFGKFGTSPGRAWAARKINEVVGIAYEIASAANASLTVTVDEKFGNLPGGPARTYSRSFEGATLSVSVPAGIRQGQSEACTADQDGKTVVRGIEWLPVEFDPPNQSREVEGAGVGLIVERTGMARPVPHEPLLRIEAPSVATAAVESDQPTPTMEVLELRVMSEGTLNEPLPRTAGMWELPDAAHTRWRLHARQRLITRVYYTGQSTAARKTADELNKKIGDGAGPEVEVRWQLAPTVLDPDGSSPVSVGDRESLAQYGVIVEAGPAIKASAPGLKKVGKLAAKTDEGRWRMLVEVTPPTRVLGPAPRLSTLLNAIATITDKQGRKGEFHFIFHSYLPAFADITRNVEPPDGVLTALAIIARTRNPSLGKIPVPQMVASVAADWKVENAALSNASARRARILRNTYLISVRDGDLNAEDWLMLQGLMSHYAKGRWPDTP